MYKIDSVGATANNEFRNASDSTTGTVVDADWMNTVQDELINIVESSGATLDKNNNSQVLAALGNIFYPVGSLYFNAGANTYPGTLLGFGVWEEYATGQAIVGVGSHTDDRGESKTWTADQAEGEYRHVSTIGEMPRHRHGGGNHDHPVRISYFPSNLGPNSSNHLAGGNGAQDATSATPINNSGNIINYEGGNNPHNNIQPSIAVHIWRRTL